MKKIKTYVLIVSTQFPSTHPRVGEKTDFVYQIQEGKKIHTVRKNYDLWLDRITQVLYGHAIISVRKWTGKPYRSKQEEIYVISKIHKPYVTPVKVSEDKIEILSDHYADPIDFAENDGLSLKDFKDWIKPSDEWMCCIHFNSYSYQKRIGQTYGWQGELANVEFGYSEVTENKEYPLWWYNYECAMNGGATKIPAVRITVKGSSPFVISNQFGYGVSKLMNGGWPGHGHASLPDHSFVKSKDDCWRIQEPYYRVIEKLAALDVKRDAWQAHHFPAAFSKKEAARKLIQKSLLYGGKAS